MAQKQPRRPGVLAGHAMGRILRRPATIRYPRGKLYLDSGYRGKLVFDASKCGGCKLCMRDCPSGAITAITNLGTKEDKKLVFEMDLSRCIFCCQCIDSCKLGALQFSQDIELAGMNTEDMKLRYE